MKSARVRFLALAMVAALLATTFLAGCGSKPYPSKAIEFVVPFNPGGGSDLLARAIASVFDAEKLLKQPLTVMNKAGGSGAVGYAYIRDKQKADVPYTLGTVSSSWWTTPLLGKSDVKTDSFTPIVGLAYDTYVLLVNDKSKYKSLKDIIDAAKKAPPKTLSVAGTGATSDDRVVTYLLEKEAGVTFNYIPFNSGAEAVTDVMGGHTDMTIANPGEAMAQIEAKKMIPLAVATDVRLGGALKDTPTFKELGYGTVIFKQLRGVLGPKDFPPEDVKILETAFQKMSQSSKWTKDYVEKNLITPAFMDSKTFATAVKQMNDLYTTVFKALGQIK